jgi:D-3-phosphoglycerate dehydrogenase
MRIVLCYPVEPHHLQQIRTAAPEAEVVDAGQERIAEELFAADIYCGHAKVPVDWDGVVRQGRLQWIQSSAAGMDHCLVPSVVESDVVVTSASGVLSDQVAEHTLALITAWYRSLPVFFRAQQRKEYIRRPTGDLHERIIGIVGFGGVGRRVAQVLVPFRTRVFATDLFPVDRPDDVEALWPAERLDDLLSLADVVILALPLNATTKGMFNATTLAKMKPGALLVNMARGPLVIERDLVAALESGHLGGAALDVADPEPLPPESRLWGHPHVILTPHVGGQSARRIDNITNMFCENLRRWWDGQPLINLLVDKRLGFPIRDGKTPLWTGPTSAASGPQRAP